jgi:hypothetical protein
VRRRPAGMPRIEAVAVDSAWVDCVGPTGHRLADRSAAEVWQVCPPPTLAAQGIRRAGR